MKIAVIYARYSSDRQTEQSIEGQLHVCQDYAKRNDILIVKNYIDRAMTGTNDNREAFQAALKAFVDKNLERVKTNAIKRKVRLMRKLGLQRWDYFVTFVSIEWCFVFCRFLFSFAIQKI